MVGCPPTAEEAVATLVNIAELDRPGKRLHRAALRCTALCEGLLEHRPWARPALTACPRLTSNPLCTPPPADNDPPIKGLPGLLAAAIGRNIEEIYAGNNKGVLADVECLQQITEACR